MEPLVSVAFPVPLRRMFTYAVPAAMEPPLPGCRVVAPLSEKLLTGIVVGSPAAPPPGVPIRPIAEILDEEPLLPEELIESTRRLADRFLAPWGELLRGCLPAKLPAEGSARYEVTDAGAMARGSAEKGARGLLEELLARGPLSARELAAGRVAEGRESLRELERRGWIRPVRRPREARARTMRTVASVPASEEDVARACGRSKASREAYRLIASLGRPASLEELRALGIAPGAVRRLAAAGLLVEGEEDRKDGEPGAPAPRPGPALSRAQASVLGSVAEAISSRRFRAFLLFGVTGSGKTEIYLHGIAAAIAAGRNAIWLVPEIALTPVFARTLTGRFGRDAVVLHSALTERERSAAWEAVRRGEARVVIGPRSAVFAPLQNVGLIVVDEEHDGSYKQEESPRYDARDAAAIRADAHGAVLVLGSATPSMETMRASREGRLTLLRLPERIESRPLPRVEIVSLRHRAALPEEKGVALFTEPLIENLRETFSRGEQAILLMPRRGYAPFLLCRDCGNDFRCDHCSVTRTLHRRSRALLCHYCGDRKPVPARCPSCGGDVLEAVGAGTERVAERFAALFPGVPFAILDSDTARRRNAAAAIVGAMENGTLQALIGTQMVAKGHHFPNVTAIGILSADTTLNLPDFRSAEKTFQLLTQAAGRAGRGERPGAVFIQTFHPDNPAITLALAHDADAFADRELAFRRTFFYPPYCEMACVVVAGADRETAREAGAAIARSLSQDPDLRVSGPDAAPIERIAGRWRYQVLVRSRSRRAVLRGLEAAVPEAPSGGLTVRVDVDPRSLM